MPFKITMPKKFQKLLDPNSKEGLVAQTRKQFSKRGTVKVKQAIVQDMIRGISPVKGKGKWKRYSKSYKDVIQNKAAYRKVGGKIVRFSADNAHGFSNKQFSSLRPDGDARKARRVRPDGDARKARRVAQGNLKQKVKDMNSAFHAGANPKKQISPVNLRYSGKLHRSLKVFTSGGFLRNFRMITEFRNKLADIHNRLGAGKSKAIRRLLPTRKGERFNVKIEGVIFTELKKAADFVAKQFSGQ